MQSNFALLQIHFDRIFLQKHKSRNFFQYFLQVTKASIRIAIFVNLVYTLNNVTK